MAVVKSILKAAVIGTLILAAYNAGAEDEREAHRNNYYDNCKNENGSKSGYNYSDYIYRCGRSASNTKREEKVGKPSSGNVVGYRGYYDTPAQVTTKWTKKYFGRFKKALNETARKKVTEKLVDEIANKISRDLLDGRRVTVFLDISAE